MLFYFPEEAFINKDEGYFTSVLASLNLRLPIEVTEEDCFVVPNDEISRLSSKNQGSWLVGRETSNDISIFPNRDIEGAAIRRTETYSNSFQLTVGDNGKITLRKNDVTTEWVILAYIPTSHGTHILSHATDYCLYYDFTQLNEEQFVDIALQNIVSKSSGKSADRVRDRLDELEVAARKSFDQYNWHGALYHPVCVKMEKRNDVWMGGILTDGCEGGWSDTHCIRFGGEVRGFPIYGLTDGGCLSLNSQVDPVILPRVCPLNDAPASFQATFNFAFGSKGDVETLQEVELVRGHFHAGSFSDVMSQRNSPSKNSPIDEAEQTGPYPDSDRKRSPNVFNATVRGYKYADAGRLPYFGEILGIFLDDAKSILK